MTYNRLTIFYDGNCPLCTLEMQKLQSYDTKQKIVLEDLHQENFESLFPQININQAMKILHGEYQGDILLGLAVTHSAWTLVGKGTLVAPLKFPIIKQLADFSYLLVAKYRQPISHFLYQKLGIGVARCSSKSCFKK